MPSHRKAKGSAKLSEIEQRFVGEMLIHLSQTLAMERADGSGKKKSWKELGYQMAQRPHVKAAIEEGLKRQFEKLEATALDVKREIARMAMFDPAHVTGVTCPEDIARLPEDVRRAIVGWSWDRQGNFTVKLAKEGALEMLGRHHGLFEKDKAPPSVQVVIHASPHDEKL